MSEMGDFPRDDYDRGIRRGEMIARCREEHLRAAQIALKQAIAERDAANERAEAAEGRAAELEAREQAHIGEIEAVRMVWQDYALAPDTDLTPDAQEFKRQLREIVGIDAAEKRAEKWREWAYRMAADVELAVLGKLGSKAEAEAEAFASSELVREDCRRQDDAAVKAEKEQAHE